MHERKLDAADKETGCLSGFSDAPLPIRERDRPRSGFAIAPILYLLGLVGVGAAVLFSGYSQILRTNQNITNNLQTKNDLNGNATTMAATSVLSADTTLLCPPTAGSPSVNCTASSIKLTAIAGQTQLPANTAGVAGSGGSAPKEVGVFTAGSGMTQLDAWGHYYIVCRWENPTSPGSGPAFMIISAGPSGSLQTKCTDTAAKGDNLIIEWPVTTAVNRSAVWQATVSGGSTTSVQFGQVGSQLVVDASGDLTVPGTLHVSGASTLAGVTVSSVSGGTGSFSSLSVSGNETVGGTLGVTGATSLSTLSTTGLATLNTAAVTGNATVGGTLGVTGLATLNTAAVTGNATVGGTLGVTGDTNLGSTLETGGLATLNSLAVTNNANISGTLGAGATTLDSLTVTHNASVGGTLTVTGVSHFTGTLNGSNAVFTGTVQASNFVGTISGGSISWGSTLVPLTNGGSGYAASSVLDLLTYLGGTNASNLTSGTLPSGRIASGEITSGMMAAPGADAGGPYYQIYVDSAGRVTSDSTSIVPIPASISDGSGDSITADAVNGLTFDTNSSPVMRIDRTGKVSIGTTTAAVSLDLSKETDALALPSGTTAQRPGSPVNGDIRYNSDSGIKDIEAYVNGAWSAIVTTGGGTSIASGVDLGTSTGATNPQRTGDVTTGLFSPATGTVAVASGGGEVGRFTSTGLGIGTTSIANALDIYGSAAFGTYGGAVTGAANEVIVGGKIGIGNTSPGALLDIGSAAATLGTMRLEGNTSGYVQIQPSANAGSWTLTLPPNAGTNTYVLQTDGSGTTSWVVNGADANIGLGTAATATNPQRPGQPGTGLYSAASNTVSVAANGSDVADFTTTGESVTGSVTASTSVISPLYTATGATVIKPGSDSTTAVQIETSGGAGILDVDTTDSYVGIGTTGPANKLDVNGGVAIGTYAGTAGLSNGLIVSGPVAIGTSSLTPALGQTFEVDGNMVFTANTGSNRVLFSNGNTDLVLQAGDGNHAITVGKTSNTLTLREYGDIVFIPGSSGTEAARIKGTGNVGIGTTSPNALLDIGSTGTTRGTLRLESSTAATYVQLQPSTTSGSWTLTLPSSAGTANYLLQTDGSGNTSWASLGGAGGIPLNLGTSAAATNPQRPGQPGTGFYSDTSNEVEVAIGGANLVTWTASAENLTGTITQGSYSIGYKINGNNAVWQDAANYNLAVGATSFPTTVNPDGSGNDGQANVAVGYQALNANTTGNQNTAIGYLALAANTTGVYNTAVGYGALHAGITGANNTAIGFQALYADTIGSYNTAVGYQALVNNITGNYNTALGFSALVYNTTGVSNTALGYAALGFNSTGTDNTAVGINAMLGVNGNRLTGKYNTGIGDSALYTIQGAGANNTTLGYNAEHF